MSHHGASSHIGIVFNSMGAISFVTIQWPIAVVMFNSSNLIYLFKFQCQQFTHVLLHFLVPMLMWTLLSLINVLLEMLVESVLKFIVPLCSCHSLAFSVRRELKSTFQNIQFNTPSTSIINLFVFIQEEKKETHALTLSHHHFVWLENEWFSCIDMYTNIH